MSIEVRDLSHIYMEGSPFQSIALSHINVTIEDGELIGLIGHTGSGKSTFVQHLNALLKPTSGQIFVDGLELFHEGTNLRDVRRKVGLVFQYPEYQLFEETVEKDIAFGPKNLGLSDAEALERAKEAAALVGLSDSLLTRSPFELSGGQKRRVAIAGVLAMHPNILILDEPAAGLDPSGRRDMLKLLKKLHADGERTLLMVSHSMTDVATLCKRVLVMNKGAIAMDGAPGDIFSQAEDLMQMGLGLPAAAQLCHALRAEGFSDIPEGLWRMEDVESAILASLKGGASK